jgi:hypothetical protein
MDDSAAMGRLIDALRPWLRDLVFVGGWAHRLHRLHPLAHPPAYNPLRTRDADIAFSTTAPLAGNIRAALEEAGFEQVLSGDESPAIAEYRLGDEDQGFFAEFIAPLRGSGIRRDGTPDATVSKAGITAQKLRHVDVLLIHPWSVGLGSGVGPAISRPTEIQLVNPVSFIAQKLLIHSRRPPAKQAQDALYIHDTLELFAGELETLRSLWRGEVAPSLPRATTAEVERLQKVHFRAVTDIIRTAVRIPTNRMISAERLQAACAYGLETIFER